MQKIKPRPFKTIPPGEIVDGLKQSQVALLVAIFYATTSNPESSEDRVIATMERFEDYVDICAESVLQVFEAIERDPRSNETYSLHEILLGLLDDARRRELPIYLGEAAVNVPPVDLVRLVARIYQVGVAIPLEAADALKSAVNRFATENMVMTVVYADLIMCLTYDLDRASAARPEVSATA